MVYARDRREGRTRPFEKRLLLRAGWLLLANGALAAIAPLFAGTPSFPGAGFFEFYWHGTPPWLRYVSLNQPGVLHVLPRYAVFLLAAPPLLRLATSRAGVLVPLLSLALWLAHLRDPRGWRVPLLESPFDPIFPVAAWQMLFFVGMSLTSWSASRTDAAPRRGPWLAVGAGVLVAVAVWVRVDPPGPALRPYTDRASLGVLRLTNFALAAAVSWMAVDRWRAGLVRAAGWLLLPLGRGALAAFLLHVPLVWLMNLLPWRGDTSPLRLAAAVLVAVGVSRLVAIPPVRKALAPV